MTARLHAAMDALFKWIVIHQAFVLDGMTNREQRDFTATLGNARTALAAGLP